MRSHQREAILVVLHCLEGNVPSFDRMAALTGCAHLPAVNIGMAVGAFGAHVGEHRLGVTLHTGHVLVHAL